MEEYIEIKGARVNNLKNVSLRIPRDRLVVVTGLSGSGKSSLAFDTLYAEGQRRYVESLSSYARQFLGRMNKPECDHILGIPPAIAIEQKVTSRNPRSTVGTSTEVYEYLRLLYARVGHTFSPVSGQEVRKHTVEDVVRHVASRTPGTRFSVLCQTRTHAQTLLQQGFARIEVNGEVTRIEDYQPAEGDTVYLVVDRLQAGDGRDTLSRLTDSVETAFAEGAGRMALRFHPDGELVEFSNIFEADGITFEEPTDNLFAFNSPAGACPKCEGFGRVVGIDERLVVPDTSLSVYQGAVMPWRGEKLRDWKKWFCRLNATRGFPIHKPYYALTQEERDWLWHGTFPSALPPEQRELSKEEREWGLLSIDAFFEMLRQGQYKIQNRVMLARYRGRTVCPQCQGRRLRPEAGYVQVGGQPITDLVDMPIAQLREWFAALQLPEHEQLIAKRILAEINNRLNYIVEVGLGYLTLNRLSNTLSGGESQRINLASSLGSSLVGSLYILDEPSIGLHSRDTQRLIAILKQLRDLGNTVLVVEHDEEIMRAADWLIDIGPEAGSRGGEIIYQGLPTTTGGPGHTMAYLAGQEVIPTPQSRRPWNAYIEVQGARANNLKGIDARFPLNAVTCVTGVSGSGKSSLVHDILYLALKRRLDETCDHPGEHAALAGSLDMVKAVEYVGQAPAGRSTRSNPVTYIKAWDEIRALLAEQPLAKQMGMQPGHFSFNSEGGRCPACKGDGTTTVEMQFMADLELECEECHGRRFKRDVLEVKFHDRNAYDILQMTVDEAVEFFTQHDRPRIAAALRPLAQVGLGYVKLGQSSSTLSGGENQRLKLASYLGKERRDPTLFIFDEPTTGLHPRDIATLMRTIDALVCMGHTFIIIEHNMDVIKCADHVIDIGPEGGADGGQIVTQGTPEQVAACPSSHTGRLLRGKL